MLQVPGTILKYLPSQRHEMNAITGLVVCGGHSTRMGQDKSLIAYHDHPQWLHMASLLRGLCNKVCISCRRDQVNQFQGDYPVQMDAPEFAEYGPMNALLTAFKLNPNDSYLMVGCDYPLLTTEDLQRLLESRAPETMAVCMYDEAGKSEEPLIAVYESTIYKLLLTQYKEGNYSLRHLLHICNAKRVLPHASHSVTSVDTPELAHQIIKSIG